VEIVNRADPITHCGTRKLEDWRICGGDDLHAKTLKRCAEITLVAHSKVRYNGSVATEATSDTDGLVVGYSIELAHRGVA
jgi:hypothetical protein